jgi:hypothetical protein
MSRGEHVNRLRLWVRFGRSLRSSRTPASPSPTDICHDDPSWCRANSRRAGGRGKQHRRLSGGDALPSRLWNGPGEENGAFFVSSICEASDRSLEWSVAPKKCPIRADRRSWLLEVKGSGDGPRATSAASGRRRSQRVRRELTRGFPAVRGGCRALSARSICRVRVCRARRGDRQVHRFTVHRCGAARSSPSC